MNALARFKAYEHKTFGDAAELYLAEFDGKCKERQVYALCQVLRFIEDIPLIDVDESAMAEYKEVRSQERMAGTVNKEIGTVLTVLNRAAKVWRWIPWVPEISTISGPVRKSHPLTWEEEVKLLSRLNNELQGICTFVLNTGLMKDELFRLRWQDGREKGGVEYYVIKNGYDGRKRPIVLNTVSRRILDSIDPGESETIFRRTDVNLPLRKAWKESGLPGNCLIRKGIDNLRVTYGVRLRAAGAAPDEYDYMMGRNHFKLAERNAVIDLRRLAELSERLTKVTDAELAIYI